MGRGDTSILRRRSRLIGLAAIVLALILWLIPPAAATQTVTIDYAKSGNTLELLFELSPEQPVTAIRLAAIEAPDRDQEPWGSQARDCLADLRDQIIQLELVDNQPDAYNRLWAYGWQQGELINATSLAQGCTYLADPTDEFSPHYQELLYAQERSRLLGLGIWDPQNPLRETAQRFRERSPSP
ncbi:thermonuclease family protein [Halomicronema sp. CCY15110]|uniref:thermonuclease family protein n=1 Tax=Halomicronema sp. CCY15110 TaxID=2767773 RepID=UPI001950A2A4|nr:thermonuclease family protein [Halomicronema sp. CCY15110]